MLSLKRETMLADWVVCEGSFSSQTVGNGGHGGDGCGFAADVVVNDVSSDSLSAVDVSLFEPRSAINPVPHAKSTNFVVFAPETVDEAYMDHFVKVQQPAREAYKVSRAKKAIKSKSFFKGSKIVISSSSSEEEDSMWGDCVGDACMYADTGDDYEDSVYDDDGDDWFFSPPINIHDNHKKDSNMANILGNHKEEREQTRSPRSRWDVSSSSSDDSSDEATLPSGDNVNGDDSGNKATLQSGDMAVWNLINTPERLKYFLTANIHNAMNGYASPASTTFANMSMAEPQSILSIDIGVKNLGYAVITYTEPIFALADVTIDFGICNISEGKGASDNIVASRCSSLLTFLSTMAYKYNLTRIIIEKQVPTNVKAMELMYAIYGMASILLGTTDSDKLVIYDPKLKFTTLGVPYNTKNKAHKRQSITYATKLFDTVFKNSRDRFANHSKKDDIADSLNQGLIWMVDHRVFENMNVHDLKVCYGIAPPKVEDIWNVSNNKLTKTTTTRTPTKTVRAREPTSQFNDINSDDIVCFEIPGHADEEEDLFQIDV